MQNDEMEKAVARGLPVQLSHSVDSQVSISNTARSFSEVRRRTYEGYLRVEGLRDRGTGGNGRSRASGGQRSSEGLDIRSDGDSQGQDSNRNIQTLPEPEAEAILGKPLLEPRLLRDDDRVGRRENTTLRAISGRSRAARRE